MIGDDDNNYRCCCTTDAENDGKECHPRGMVKDTRPPNIMVGLMTTIDGVWGCLVCVF